MNNYWDSFDCEIQCEELDSNFLEELTEETFIISALESE